MDSPADPLTAFLSFIPYGGRQKTATIIIKLRKALKEHIDSSGSVLDPLRQITALKSVFTHIPITLRRPLRKKALEAIEKCIECPEAVSIFVLLLSILELSTIRNSDRCDLESTDICKCIPSVNSLVNSLSNSFDFERINLLSLRAWAVATLVYTYRQCIIWCYHQDCIDFEEHSLETRVPLGPEIRMSASLPKLLAVALDCQITGTAPPVPKGGHLLSDLLMASAFSDITKNMAFYTANSLPVNQLENNFDRFCAVQMFSQQIESIESSSAVPTLSAVKDALTRSDFPGIEQFLRIVGRKLLDNVHLTNEFKETCKVFIRSAPIVLMSSYFKVDTQEESAGKKAIYCSLYCEFLRLWIYVLDKRLVLDELPQSYLYLGGFMNAGFQEMPLKGFIQAVNLQSHFLTTYLRVFKSNILASPHWFIQMMCDSVTAIIDRLSSATNDEDLSAIECAICPCIGALSRTWASLRADESDVRHELSRAVKGLLDTVVVRIATSSAPTSASLPEKGDTKWRNGDRSTISERTVVGPRPRQMLENGLLFPVLEVIDVWALQQSRIGLKPAAACEVLKKIVTRHAEKQEEIRDKLRAGEINSHPYHRPPISHAAVSGLAGGRLKAKSTARRNRH